MILDIFWMHPVPMNLCMMLEGSHMRWAEIKSPSGTDSGLFFLCGKLWLASDSRYAREVLGSAGPHRSALICLNVRSLGLSSSPCCPSLGGCSSSCNDWLPCCLFLFSTILQTSDTDRDTKEGRLCIYMRRDYLPTPSESQCRTSKSSAADSFSSIPNEGCQIGRRDRE